MKFKKSISAALAAATLMSSVSIVSYAESDAAMKQALTYVKQRIDIPEELNEFTYRSGVSNNRNYYNFNWTNEDNGDYSNISARIIGQVITSYSHIDSKANDFEDGSYSFGKLTQEEILKKAEEWVKKLNPTIYKNIEILEDTLNVSISNNRARVNIRRVKNGIPVNGQTGSMVIDKNTGRLIDFRISWTMGASFANPEKTVSVETAIDGYKLDIPVELIYTTEYDYTTKIYTPHLIYRQTKSGQIDALTGRLSTFEESYAEYGDDDDVEVEEDAAVGDENPGAGGGVNFTPEEIEKMEVENNLIKADQAVKNLHEMGIFAMGNNPQVDYSNCSYDERLGAYTRYVSFSSNDKNYYPIDDEPIPLPEVEEIMAEEVAEEEELYTSGSFTINAETGEILNFYTWSGNNADKKLTKKNATKLLNSYLEKLAGDKAEEFKLTDLSYRYSSYNIDGTPAADAYITSVSSSSPRYIYDIPSTAEDVGLTINSSKKITSYHLDYYGIEYPEPEGIISADEAYDSFFEQTEFALQYRLAVKEKKTLSAIVYNTSDYLCIDAFTGKRTNWNGSEITETYKGGYTDLEGCEYREIAEKLAMYNITLMDEQGRLNADAYITREDFASLAREIGCYYYNNGASGSMKLTRQFAAKILTSSVISEECAELSGIFKSPFSDVSESNKYVGYIAVANAMGLMEGKNGKFRPSSKVTRGEALQLIYDYLA